MEKKIWNARIDKMQKFPFKNIMELYAKKNYFLILVLVILINSTMVIFQFLIGLVLLSPFLVILQGTMIGMLLSQADKKTVIFSLVVLPFELGAFSCSAALGFSVGINWIFLGSNLISSIRDLTLSLFFIIPIICLFLNGVIEASGIFFDIEGVPGIKAVKNKLYK